jgi:hypothetical protein
MLTSWRLCNGLTGLRAALAVLGQLWIKVNHFRLFDSDKRQEICRKYGDSADASKSGVRPWVGKEADARRNWIDECG